MSNIRKSTERFKTSSAPSSSKDEDAPLEEQSSEEQSLQGGPPLSDPQQGDLFCAAEKRDVSLTPTERSVLMRQINRDRRLSQIREQPKGRPRRMGFSPSLLLRVTFPHSDPLLNSKPEDRGIPLWSKTNGNTTLDIRSGYYRNKKGKVVFLGPPFGGMGRWILWYLTTKVKRTGDPRVDLGETQADLMKDLGYESAGGSNLERVKDQIMRLALASIQYEVKINPEDQLLEDLPSDMQAQGITKEGFSRRDQFFIASQVTDLWFYDGSGNPRDQIISGTITLSDEFYEVVQAGCFPGDLRKLRELRGSPLAMDLYAWITHKNDDLRKKGEKELYVGWDDLQKQFGTSIKRTARFGQRCRSELKKIHKLYPFRYETPRGRLHLLTSPSDVAST